MVKTETLRFNPDSGIALDEESKQFSRHRVAEALTLAQDRLLRLKGFQSGKCFIEIRGVGGSFASDNQKQRIGLFPKGVIYDNARDQEDLRCLSAGIEVVYPSDVDISIRVRGVETLEDGVDMNRRVREVLSGIFDETRVLIDIHEGDSMNVISVNEVVERLKG